MKLNLAQQVQLSKLHAVYARFRIVKAHDARIEYQEV